MKSLLYFASLDIINVEKCTRMPGCRGDSRIARTTRAIRELPLRGRSNIYKVGAP